MDDSSSKEPQEDDAKNEGIDLSELKSFSFGTQWSPSSAGKSGPERPRPAGRGPSRGDRPDRSDRPDRRPSGPERKDRRPQRREARPEAAPAAAGEQPQGERRSGGAPRPSGPRGRREGGQRPLPPKPYESPVFEVGFYPDDNCFTAIIKAMRANHLTYELFEVAKLFMEKPDRYIASITRKAAAGEKPEKVFICALDNMPFATEEEALLHTVKHHTAAFFDIEEIEVEPPSGSFPFVNRCPFTKVLLGPPNYHKYEETLRHHHRNNLANMPFEKLRASIETVRDEEAVNQWLESMKKATRYTTKVAEGETSQSFNSLDDAIGYIRTAAKSKAIRQVNYARVSGAILEKYQDSEAFKAVDGERKRQARFPLDTANAIRGRMRREKFSIYKKGSKGVTYVCSTKRNFRTPGQVMAPALDRLIRFLEANQTIKTKELSAAFEKWLATEVPEESFDEKKLLRDLHWLVADGYVTHFSDDSLFAQPVLEPGAQGGDKPKGPKPAAGSKAAEQSDETDELDETEALSDEAPDEVEPEAIEAPDEQSEPAAVADEAVAAVEEPAELPQATPDEPDSAPETVVAEPKA